MFVRVFFVLIALSITACAVHQSEPVEHTDLTRTGPGSEIAAIDADYLMSGKALFGKALDPDEQLSNDLLAISPEMREFLNRLAPGEPLPARWRELISRFNRDQFVIEYNAQTTLSAAETFEARTGNCLAVTLLMVALTRELGIDASFNQVEIPELREFDGEEAFVNYRHINMVANTAGSQKVIDFGLVEYDPTMYQYQISDRQAFSQYYSNRAMEVMRSGSDKQRAFRLIRHALELAPSDSNIWLNLGAMYKRNGNVAEAEQSYLLALQLDDKNTVAMTNLGKLYRDIGKEKLAEQFFAKASNPASTHGYSLYYEAKNSYAKGNFHASKSTLARALDESANDHRMHFLMGKTQFQLGDYKQAKLHLTKAFSLLDSQDIKQVYESELSELQNSRRQ